MALTESRVRFVPGSIGKAIDDEEVTVAEIVAVLGLCDTNVAIKSGCSIRFYLRCLCSSHNQTNHEASEQGHRPAASDQLRSQ